MSTPSSNKSVVTTIAAWILSALYVWACWYLLQRFALDQPLPELQWQRALIIFSGISSVGFTAVGVLLGTTVQQVHVTAAREQAANAKADADKKAGAIKDALTTLGNAPTGKPDDLGGGGVDRHVTEAHRILLEALA